MTLKGNGEALEGDQYVLKGNKDILKGNGRATKMHKGKSLKADGVH